MGLIRQNLREMVLILLQTDRRKAVDSAVDETVDFAELYDGRRAGPA